MRALRRPAPREIVATRDWLASPVFAALRVPRGYHALSMRLRTIPTLPLRFYRRFISPLKPPMCRFSPTCSQYAIEAFEIHGIFIGFALATWRVLRCQPFGKNGFDPVPPKGRAFQRSSVHHSHEHCGSSKRSIAREPSADA